MQFFTNSALTKRTLDNLLESFRKLKELDGPWLRIIRWVLGYPLIFGGSLGTGQALAKNH